MHTYVFTNTYAHIAAYFKQLILTIMFNEGELSIFLLRFPACLISYCCDRLLFVDILWFPTLCHVIPRFVQCMSVHLEILLASHRMQPTNSACVSLTTSQATLTMSVDLVQLLLMILLYFFQMLFNLMSTKLKLLIKLQIAYICSIDSYSCLLLSPRLICFFQFLLS